jgi:NADH:ubiquinone oxidoreductase subunit K
VIVVAAALGGLGLVCALYRKTLLGVLIGVQLMFLGATMIFVLAGFSSGALVNGHAFGLFITLGGVGQLVVGYALAVRLFYLKKRAGMDELRSLKH